MTSRVLALGVMGLLVAVGTSGCLFWPWGGCGPYYHGATWEEPGLFLALPDDATRHPVDEGAFPFLHPEAEARWGPYYGVSSAWFNTGEGHGRGEALQVMLHPGHSASDTLRYGGNTTFVYARGADTHEDAAWRDAIETFLDVTRVVTEEREGWIAALLADRSFEAEGREWGDPARTVTLISADRPVQTEPDLTPIADRLGPPDPPVGTADERRFKWTTDNGTWEFHLVFAVRDLLIEAPTPGETETLTVNAADEATVTIEQGMGDNETAIQGWLQDRFAAHGLPEPRFADFRVDTAVC